MKKITIAIGITLAVALIGMAMFSKRQDQVAVNTHSKTDSKANSSVTWHKGMELQEAMEQKISLSGGHVKQSNESGEATLEAETDGGEERMAASSDSEEEREREGRRNNFRFTRRLKLTQDSIGKVVIKANDAPMEGQLIRSGKSFNGDVRTLPQNRAVAKERPEREGPAPNPFEIEPTSLKAPQPLQRLLKPTKMLAPAPAAILGFEGLDRQNWGAGSPPDTNGDVGPNHYIQSVNTSVGIYDKTNGTLITAFTFDTLMSQGNFGNQCDTENFGDPVVLYDTFEDRWILTDFAFTLDGGGNVNPPIAYQCFAVSKTGNPVTGGWNFYSTTVTDALNDYPKFGVWTDGIYMSSNLFAFPAGGSFQGVRTWSFNKAQMYAGAPTAQSVAFNVGGGDFTLIPSNARLQTGTPPAGRPNLFVSTWLFTNALTVYKFHVDWAHPSLSTLTGPDTPLAATNWPNAAVANAPQSGTATLLDVLQIRAMVQNQYTNYSGTESLWATHTIRRANTTGFAAPRWYQVNVTGGTVAANLPQAATWDPDGANTFHRFMPSLALDRAGNMALGYSKSSSTTFPSFSYAGRLASDAVNTFSLTEQNLFVGTASQTGSSRWGDYSSMTLDPDGCTFWYTTEYANPASQAFDMRWKTRVNSFSYASIGQCTPVGAGGTISGTVTVTPGGAPISGATVALGSRTATTNGSGFYQFLNIPAGTYPTITASAVGYNSSTATNIVVTDGNTTTQDFSLATAPLSACPTDTTQLDFQSGVPTAVDLVASPGDVILAKPSLDQQNGTLGTSGVGITVTTYGGQTFTPAVTGTLTKVDVNLFCSGCSGTTPNLTLSVRATSAGLPTGADLATATITGFNSGSSAYYTGTFASPPTLTAGTQYALVIRPTANPSPGTYALTRSGTSTLGSDVYAGGTRVSGTTSGTVWSIPLTGGVSTDAGFRTYMDSGFFASGNLVSGTKDANPAVGLTTHWTTLSWTATTPANTSVQFQVAGSNSPFGPFNFVGPDNTAGTFFTTSGASLSQFNGLRYLQYKAYLATSNSAVTPTLSDVTVCYVNGTAPQFTSCSNLTATAAAGQCSASVSFNPTASGPPSPTITCKLGATTITSPFTFPVGVSTVNCTASNGFAPDATCSFTVTVTDSQAPTITCPANIFLGTNGTSAVASWAAPSVSDNCPGVGVPTCTPASGSSFNVGVTTVTCTVKDAGNNTASCSFAVTVNRVSGTASDPLACTGPGNTVQATLVISNNGNVNQTVADTTTFTNLVGLPNTCTVSPNVGTCTVTNGSLTYNGTLTPGQTVTISYLTQVSDLAPAGAQVCTNNSVTFNGGQPFAFSACKTVTCPPPGPGSIFPATSEAGDQKAGSVLVYNVYTSGATSGNTQNTRINLTNIHPQLPAYVHLFFVAEGCSIADSYLCLTGNQTASFLASDLDPGTTGYLVAVAVNSIGCPTGFNYLVGDEYVKFTSGHAANLGAVAFSQLAGGLPLCDGNSVTATLNFDGVSYNRTPAALALDSIGSRADGNDTLVVVNRIGGNLGLGASTLGTLFGVFYDDAENSLSFSVSGNCQLRNSISNNFPRTTPRFETFIPAGRTGWAKVFNQTGAIGITGSAINFNPNAASSAGAFNQGHNLHVLTLTNTASYVIPVFPPSC